MKKRTIALFMAALMVFGATVGATIAWLTSTPDPVVNTFTVGDVVITLDEYDYDEDEYLKDNVVSTPESSSEEVRDLANEYHLLPGKSYRKDPIVHVDELSENCYLFVTVVNEIEDIEAAPTIESQIAANGWTHLGDGLYVYGEADEPEVVTAGDHIPVFENFTISEAVTNSELATYAPSTDDSASNSEETVSKKVEVTAYAIQAEGLENLTALDIWAKF